MEKIYMEDNNNKKSTTNRFLKGNGIVTASVLIAIVAVFAFVATSFNNPSWAAVPAVDSNLPDDFTLKLEGNDSRTYIASNESDSLPVSRFWANDRDKGISVFCLEKNIDATDGTSYHFNSSDTSASDYGILYILANGYYNKDSFTKDLDDTERVVVTQLALWNYLYDKDTNGESSGFSTIVSKYGIANGKATRDFYTEIYTDTNTRIKKYENKIYNNYISKLVSAAKTAKASDTMPSISISGGNDNISLTEDKKYYQSSAITTVSSGNTKEFKVSVDDSSPKGTILVDDKGEALDENAAHAVGKEFFVRVPVDSVSDKGATVNLSLSAIGYKYTGKVYKAYDTDKKVYKDGQKVIGVNVEQHETKEGAQVKFDYVPEVPNTGMNTSQIIYFIGLVILVCGVGIVYANIKPKESN